jgi:hypothetical protein
MKAFYNKYDANRDGMMCNDGAVLGVATLCLLEGAVTTSLLIQSLRPVALNRYHGCHGIEGAASRP